VARSCSTSSPPTSHAGSWTDSNPLRAFQSDFDLGPPETSTYHISPGDLDEGIKALLVFRGEGDTERQGAGFERVRAFGEGVMEGAEACLGYQA
jgi:hypothetical protein